MPGRRRFLKGLLGLLLLPAAGRAAAAPAPGGFHLVNGWVLTGRDLAALRAIAGRRPVA